MTHKREPGDESENEPEVTEHLREWLREQRKKEIRK